MTFFEINPQVIEFANRYFTYLKDSEAAVNIVQGDARLSLEQHATAVDRFDVLVVDAFSGDAIPVHLLTREASAVYWKALRDDGVLAIHVTKPASRSHADRARHGARGGEAGRVHRQYEQYGRRRVPKQLDSRDQQSRPPARFDQFRPVAGRRKQRRAYRLDRQLQ
jgi:spermidine synthase